MFRHESRVSNLHVWLFASFQHITKTRYENDKKKKKERERERERESACTCVRLLFSL